jgi:hypothetical protein
MKNNKLNDIKDNLPDWVSWIQWDNTMIFKKWNEIQAWCSASGGNVITLTSDSVNKIIDFDCDAYTKEWNRCWNKNVDSDTCLIYPQIKNTTK